jgi:hypothetical protein
MLRRLFAVALALTAMVACVRPSGAQPPAPIDPKLFSFPGVATMPATARSASLALADRWLGVSPYDNPAAAATERIELTPVLLRVSRQDLHGQNRDYSEQSGYFDLAGGALSFQHGALGVSLYAQQPLVRLEDNTFTLGLLPSAQPGVFTTSTAAREFIGGLAVSLGNEAMRFGAAAEWVRRDDRYETKLDSGSPSAGTTTTDFAGDGVGVNVGTRLRFVPREHHPLVVGGGFRFLPSLQLTGHQTSDLQSGLTTATVATTRSASWQGGLSSSYEVTPAFHALAAFGGHGEESYDAWDVTRGIGSEWALAGDYHDARDPWTFQFGFGQEQQDGTPEPRAGRVSLGFGWLMDSTTLDLGIEHLTIQRPGEPNSTDDRVLLGLTQTF